ncbi:MAG: hypothetical protein U0Z75_04500 [Deinococcaceae bacterium]
MSRQMPVGAGKAHALVQAVRGKPMSRQATLAEMYLRDSLQGVTLENDVAQLRIGRDKLGFYYQLRNYTSTFQGATLPYDRDELTQEACRQLIWEAISAYRNREAQVFLIYETDYVFNENSHFLGFYPGSSWDNENDPSEDAAPIEQGNLRLEIPLFARLDIDSPTPIGGLKKGTLIVFRLKQHILLMTIPASEVFLAPTALC